MDIKPGTFWLTRIAFLRSIAFIYNVAFAVALFQNKALIGRHGLLPGHTYLKDLAERMGIGRNPPSPVDKLKVAPTILWFVSDEHFDYYLDAIAYAGLGLSFVIMITGASNMFGMALLWVLYHCLVNVGQRWYSFGWESQLLETGFLAIWFCPLFEWAQIPDEGLPPRWVAVYGLRWLIFRIMLGAGLIKIRGDQCWRDLTCMNYHYETQPVPNPLSYFMHQSPEFIHKLEVLGNHFIELVAPFLMWLPHPCALIGGLIQIFFQVVLIISGNLSFLNWLTILPSIACLDDRFLAPFFPDSTRRRVFELQTKPPPERSLFGKSLNQTPNIVIAALIAYLSIPVIQNLVSAHQVMNTSFDPLRLVNTYGAFGSVTKERTEVIVQGTHASDPADQDALWLEYEFKVKPGTVDRRPKWISPYHYRLDWLMWFAAFQNYQHNPWLIHLVARLLKNDPLITELIEHNPFGDGDPPKFIRLEHYRYRYTRFGSEAAKSGKWWTRRRIGSYMPAVDYYSLKAILKRFHWIES